MELQDRGYRVPEDVLVTGFDNVSIAKDNSPRITTVDCDRETMGYRACEYLMTKTAKEIQKLCVQIPTTQIYSESCGCEREGRWQRNKTPLDPPIRKDQELSEENERSL